MKTIIKGTFHEGKNPDDEVLEGGALDIAISIEDTSILFELKKENGISQHIRISYKKLLATLDFLEANDVED